MSLKPFYLEEKKSGPKGEISETTFSKWQQVTLANIKKEANWLPYTVGGVADWDVGADNRGLDTAARCVQVEAMLTYIAQYAPSALHRDITRRANSLTEVWQLVKEWANIRSTGCKFQSYAHLRKSFKQNGDQTHNDFFYTLRNGMEDTLLEKDGEVRFRNRPNNVNETLTPCLESMVVLDWMEAIGGQPLQDQVFRVFAKDLESATLADIRPRISDNMEVLLAEAESTVQACRATADIKWANTSRETATRGRGSSWNRGRQGRGSTNSIQRGNSRRQQGRCRLCHAEGRPSSHSVASCMYLSSQDRRAVARSVLGTLDDGDQDDAEGAAQEEEELFTSEEEENDAEVITPTVTVTKANTSTKKYPVISPFMISSTTVILDSDTDVNRDNRRINIYDSPTLAVKHESTTVYIVLDCGATTSLASKKKITELSLQILPTKHKAVQVDGHSPLSVVGEVHASFWRGKTELKFSALVVDNLATDFLGGTNFLIENDIAIMMSKNTIKIGESQTVPLTTATVLELDQLDNRHRLVSVTAKVQVHPGDSITFSLPDSSDRDVVVEPNTCQAPDFFTSQLARIQDGKLTVTNTSNNIVSFKKHCQAVTVRSAVTDIKSPISNIRPSFSLLKKKSTPTILKETNLDSTGKLSQAEKQPFIQSITQHSAVFQNDLPGYNHNFGKCFASFEFATKTRPSSYKLRKPSYGQHAELLFNQKCADMREQGVLVDPAEHGIQPLLLNNAWIVKKVPSAKKPWEQCSVSDVRLVVGFDYLNKYLQNPPGMVTKSESIYSSIAGWKYCSEIDFRDCYFQIPFDLSSARVRRKLAYLAIKTAFGTMIFTRAAQGLLGMDVYQDEMMQKMFGDLILQGKVITLADNVYLGASTIQGMQDILEELLSRCEAANIKIKPSKVTINIKTADILGLHWSAGTLSPSPHKLEPLAHCEPPKTVTALRAFLGGVRFQEICLSGPQLAFATEPLDREIPASRTGKELVVWTPTLLTAFKQVQELLQNPVTVTVPRPGDTPYIVSDACTSIPACGTKLFLKRPGVSGFLSSFHHGCRLPKRMKEYSPCEVEAYALHQGVAKNAHFIKVCGQPGICLVDSKAVYQAKQKMDAGHFSTSRRIQDLVANLSAKRMVVQLISAKLPSPLLQYIDFSSRHPVQCTLSDCRICREVEEPDTTFFGAVLTEPYILSPAGWLDIQRTDEDLRRAHSILTSGTKLGQKQKNGGDLKKYLRICSVNKKGLLIVQKQLPFQVKPAELIVIPRAFAHNLARVIHHRLDHPNHSQMKQQFGRSYYTLDSDRVLKEIFDTCQYPCQASRTLPKETMNYVTETKATAAGSHLNADVMEESKQKILVLRDNLTSYTSTCVIKDQTKQTLRDALLVLASRTRLNKNPVQCRVDAHSSLKALAKDKSLEEFGVILDIGHPKNINHNPVSEKAIKELRTEIVRLSPHGGPISDKTLALATENLNSRIRHTGRSAKELWTARDQVSGANLSISDLMISEKQHNMRKASHKSSAKYESRNAPEVQLPSISKGDSVYIKSDWAKKQS